MVQGGGRGIIFLRGNCAGGNHPGAFIGGEVVVGGNCPRNIAHDYVEFVKLCLKITLNLPKKIIDL